MNKCKNCGHEIRETDNVWLHFTRTMDNSPLRTKTCSEWKCNCEKPELK